MLIIIGDQVLIDILQYWYCYKNTCIIIFAVVKFDRSVVDDNRALEKIVQIR